MKKVNTLIFIISTAYKCNNSGRPPHLEYTVARHEWCNIITGGDMMLMMETTDVPDYGDGEGSVFHDAVW